MLKNLHIICYKWGNLYSSEEVNILYSMVRKNLNVPFEFYCITDNSEGLHEDIQFIKLPFSNLPGNSNKLWTFSKGFLGLGEDQHVVSLDIDIVIVGNLDFLLANPEADFIVAKHRAKKSTSRAHGAVYRLRVGSHSQIWEQFIADPDGAAIRFTGVNGNLFSEQDWLEHHFRGVDYVYFPEEKIILFRKDCSSRAWSYMLGRKAASIGLTTARFGKAKLPGRGEAIVSFAGKVNPRDVLESHCGHLRQAPFVKEYWRVEDQEA